MKKTVTKYRISCKEMLPANIEVEYVDGQIRTIVFHDDCVGMLEAFWRVIHAVIHPQDSILTQREIILRLLGVDYTLHVEPLKVTTSQEKIVIWYDLYLEHFRQKYKFSKSDPSKAKGVPFESDLIKYFFQSTEWWAKNKTIGGYCGQINNIKLHVKNSGNNPLNHPIGYDKNYETGLDSKALMDYRRHLRENCGLMPLKDRLDNTVDWVPKLRSQDGPE